MSYTIEEHKHRFATWAASRAASTSVVCRFTVKNGIDLIEASGIQKYINRPDLLPLNEAFDKEHQEWRNAIMKQATALGLEKITHGIAAKLINVYLKTCLVCGGYHDHEKVKALHPPIDRLLLDNLKNMYKGNGLSINIPKTGWSKFSSDEYEIVISEVKLNSEW